MDDDLGTQFKALSEKMTMLRGRGAYGRKPDKRVVDQIAQWGPVSTHHYDEATGKTTIHTEQAVDAIVKANREQYLSGHDGYTPSRDLRHVARIPLGEVARLYGKGINIMNADHWPKIAALLDTSDWMAWRTSPGKIARRPERQYFTAEGSRKTVEV